MSTEIAVITLLVIASAVAMLVRRLKLPYTIALVLAGLALGSLKSHLPPAALDLKLTRELLFAVLLPALLFEAAFHLNLSNFRANARAILLLALPGVGLGVLLAGGAFYLSLPLAGIEIPVLVGLLLASILAATDPVSVISLFKELGAPKRLAVIMEGESLFNDGIAVVAFGAICAALGLGIHEAHIDALWVARYFLWELAGGLAVGLVFGMAVSWIMSQIEDHLIEITLTTILAYGSYLVADRIHTSGVIAVVAAGMMCGNYGARYSMAPTTRLAVISFWEYAVFAVNSIVFLLIGKEIELRQLLGILPAALLVFGILTVVRAAVIHAFAPLIGRWEGPLGRGWRLVLVWGGLRGGLSMVLALSLSVPDTLLDDPNLIHDLTFATVLIVLLVQGLTISPLLKRLGVVALAQERDRADRLRAQLRATRAAMRDLDDQRRHHLISADTYLALRERLAGRQASLEEGLEALAPAEGMAAEMQQALRRLAAVEKNAVREACAKGLVRDAALRDLIADIDARADSPAAHPPHDQNA